MFGPLLPERQEVGVDGRIESWRWGLRLGLRSGEEDRGKAWDMRSKVNRCSKVKKDGSAQDRGRNPEPLDGREAHSP